MNFNKSLIGLALAATASWASAQAETPAIGVVLAPAGAGTFSTSFTQPVNGFFLDTFTFTPATFSGNVAVSLVPSGPQVNFFAALLNDQGFSFFAESGATNFDFMATVNSSSPLRLQVFGFSGDEEGNVEVTGMAGSYRATITAAIPEPETYALMLAGLAFVGFWARRKRG